MGSFFIFVAMNTFLDDKIIPATDIVNVLLNKNFWAFSENAPVKHKLKPGDTVLFYVGGKGRHHFVATAKIKKPIQKIHEDKLKILQELGLSFLTYTVELSDVNWFKKEIKIVPLKEQLYFIKDKKNYGLALRLPVREISEEDYKKITSEQ